MSKEQAEAFAAYHDEHATHGGFGREFHERAASFLRTQAEECDHHREKLARVRLAVERLEQEPLGVIGRGVLETLKHALDRDMGLRDEPPPSGLCSAHRHGEDPTCASCFPTPSKTWLCQRCGTRNRLITYWCRRCVALRPTPAKGSAP